MQKAFERRKWKCTMNTILFFAEKHGVAVLWLFRCIKKGLKTFLLFNIFKDQKCFIIASWIIGFSFKLCSSYAICFCINISENWRHINVNKCLEDINIALKLSKRSKSHQRAIRKWKNILLIKHGFEWQQIVYSDIVFFL